MSKLILIGIICKKKNGKIPIILCEFAHNIKYINKNNTIIEQTYLEIDNIKQIFYSKLQFINWLKNTGNYGKIPFNKCFSKHLFEYIITSHIENRTIVCMMTVDKF